jgi:hypothetical protein
MDHLRRGVGREFIKQHLRLSDEEIDAVIEYIDTLQSEVESDYAEILRRSEERKAHYDAAFRERSGYDQALPAEERASLIRQDLEHGSTPTRPNDGNKNPARP